MDIVLPACAELIGEAINPADPSAGLSAAVGTLGERKVRQVAERLLSYQGRPLNEALGALSAMWYSTHPVGPSIEHLRALGSDAILRALAARCIAQTGHREFHVGVMDAMAPGLRTLSGLPSATDIAKVTAAQAVAA